MSTEVNEEQTGGGPPHSPTGPIVVVVGYDGTDPAKRALTRASEMLHGGPGHIEVVWVAHTPAGASMSAPALAEVVVAFDIVERDLAKEAGEALDGRGFEWHFQRRNGEVAQELIAAGKEQFATTGADTRVRLVVGGSAHKIDRYLNSVPTKIVRQDRFEVVVVP